MSRVKLVVVVALASILVGCASTTPAPKPQTYTISGRITTPDGQGVAGVTVAIAGAVSGAATTDANGRWTFAGARGGVVVTPAHPDYAFEPPQRMVSAASSSVDFVALGQTDVRFLSASAEQWWSNGEQHKIQYSVRNLGRAGQYKIEVHGLRTNVINPPWEYLGATDLLTIGAYGTQHSMHYLTFVLTLPYRYWRLRLNILVWTGSSWVQTDTITIDATRL